MPKTKYLENPEKKKKIGKDNSDKGKQKENKGSIYLI